MEQESEVKLDIKHAKNLNKTLAKLIKEIRNLKFYLYKSKMKDINVEYAKVVMDELEKIISLEVLDIQSSLQNKIIESEKNSKFNDFEKSHPSDVSSLNRLGHLLHLKKSLLNQVLKRAELKKAEMIKKAEENERGKIQKS